ncbi:MAG: SOS response-associated peptidase, partial [Phycisphaerae bacterium]|nr:SOS response-associated peptidase [Phycisphaerae bacterium]
MCGRYALALTGDAVAAALQATPVLPAILAWRERFNIAPSQDALVVVRGKDGSRKLTTMRWGLVPLWATDAAIGRRLTNARSESVAGKPAFRDAWRDRRCLIPATAFYEWQAPFDPSTKVKRPYAIAMGDGRPFTFGGLWERSTALDGAPVHTFAIITADANELMRPIHDRMPLIVQEESRNRWLTGDPPSELLAPLASRSPLDAMRAWRVSTLVNSPRN